MTTGAQAEVYADHFIANHLTEIGGGQTYAQLSAKSLAAPKNTALAAQVQAMFRGETLRGLLLNAYAFGTVGQIMLIARLIHDGDWQWLTIRPGGSQQHNQQTWGTAASRGVAARIGGSSPER